VSRELRLLALTPVFPPELGGVELLAYRVLGGLRECRVRVACLSRPGAAEFDERDALDIRRPRTAVIGGRHSLKRLNAFALRQALSFRPHVVLNLHVATAPAALVIRRLLRTPVVQYVYAKEFGAFPGLTARAVRSADAVIGISRYSCDMARAAGAPVQRLHRIPPGVDLPGGARRPRDPRLTLLTVSRLDEPYKGHDVLLRALPLIRARVPELRWVVIGDGALRPRLERAAAAAGLDEAVSFLGAVSDAERDAWLDRAHVFAMPSRIPENGAGGEGFGMVYLEANARGLPVVAGNVGGAGDAVIDGRTALLVDPCDHRSLSDAITGLLLDPEAAARMGRAGSLHAQRFAWPAIAGQVEELVAGLARGRRRGGTRP
jgi:phosphatidylinositol alpha-1,6-mannosyltransferase